MMKLFCSTALALVLLIGGVATATAQTTTIYNSIPNPLPGNVASEGPEAYAFIELGDGLDLSATVGTFGQVTVVMSSWACQSGNWTANCVTTAGATFSQAITVNIYGVDVLTPTVLLATTTQTFSIPYRPSSTPSLCSGDAQVWYDKKDKTCYHGIAVPISVSFSNSNLPIPANNRIIVTVAFNTTSAGPSPIGTSASCYLSSGGCPYDSLNISTDSNGGDYKVIGSVLDTNGIFVNYRNASSACSPSQPILVLADDTPCWTGSHPMIQVVANTNAKHQPKGNKP